MTTVRNFVFASFVLVARFSCIEANAVTSAEECAEKHNFTITEVSVAIMNHHEYKVLEECLYYFLASQATARSPTKDKRAISRAMPSDQTVTVNVHGGTIHELHDTSNNLEDMYAEGNLRMLWRDSRLSWDTTKWQMPMIEIYDSNHIWIPDIRPIAPTKGVGKSIIYVRNIHVDHTGMVSTEVLFVSQFACDTDFSDYPNDKHDCCAELRSTLFDSRIHISIDKWQSIGKVKQRLAHEIWSVKGFSVAAPKDPDTKHFSELLVCFKAIRHSSTLKLELSVPVFLCVVVVLLAPLFGDLRQQSYVKCFALLLQLLALNFLGTKTQNAFSGTTPNIYRFYEFSIVLTVGSLCLSVILMALCRMPRKVPPSHSLYLSASAFNRVMCCHNPVEAPGRRVGMYTTQNNQMGDQNNPSAIPPAEPTGEYSQDWAQVFTAINNVAALTTITIYLLGTLILMA